MIPLMEALSPFIFQLPPTKNFLSRALMAALKLETDQEQFTIEIDETRTQVKPFQVISQRSNEKPRLLSLFQTLRMLQHAHGQNCIAHVEGASNRGVT